MLYSAKAMPSRFHEANAGCGGARAAGGAMDAGGFDGFAQTLLRQDSASYQFSSFVSTFSQRGYR
jgi:hypothetical protein